MHTSTRKIWCVTVTLHYDTWNECRFQDDIIKIDWLVFYGTSTQDRSICANLPEGITGSGVWG